MTESRYGRRAGVTTCAAAAALLLFTGCTGTAAPEAGITSSAPSATVSTPASEATPTSTPALTASSPTAAATPAPEQPPVLAASDPVSLTIPATGTGSELLHLGLRDNGSLEVPPEPPGSPASWYTDSPTPGERGPAVLLGHVNATGGGPGIFADLRALTPGDRIEVTRQDGTTAVFAVDRGEQHGKDDFPTLEVYGNTEASELRLITCDGYDPATGEFDDNYVVYATLTP
ncbi:UNVERIFIED_CONTAM: class F sortase [Kocuria sp. CPCC 205316]|uniref:class F sortase n=1 Tax=Kocuria TaxID=57493 RepID=UPI0036DA16E7